jgi:flavin-dependent dehydrogenase
MYDVIIIGARCAGSGLALMLARAGLKVLAIDRVTFPSDTMSGHYLHPAGVACLRRWDLLDALAATDTPPQRAVTVDFGPVVLTGRPAPAPDGTTVGYCPRRWLFDPLLADAAAAAGAEIATGTGFQGPIFEHGRVAGIRATTRSGQSLELRARLVVGADGKRSPFAAAVGAEGYHRNPTTACTYYAYWSGFDIEHTRLFVREGRFFVASPTNQGLTFLGIMWPISEFRRVRSDISAAYRAAAAEEEWLADRLAAAKQTQRFVGTADLDGFMRRAHGAGWALLGDAGYHRDPISAQGMTDALLHAEMLAEAIVDGLGGRRALHDALADYQRRRDASVMAMYSMTNDMARLAAPPAETVELVGALQGDPEATGRFLGVISGTVAAEDFFAPANLARITGRGLAA